MGNGPASTGRKSRRRLQKPGCYSLDDVTER